jgi:DNA helicase-2/ATP-dependent DNA helicase PcrA
MPDNRDDHHPQISFDFTLGADGAGQASSPASSVGTAGAPHTAPFSQDPDVLPAEPAWLSDTPQPEAEAPSVYRRQPDQHAIESILSGLNPQQREAVQVTSGPLLIIAGPGSGKTRVLTHRIAYLMEAEGVPPWRICAVTFTNKAAWEMKHRLEGLVGRQRARDLTMGTFHALGVRILRQDAEAIGYPRDFAIYDDDDQLALVKRAMKDIDLDEKQYSPRGFLSRIAAAKAVLAGPEQASRLAETYYEELAARVYRRYQELLYANRAVDFDDLIKLTIELFTERPDILRRYQERYLHVLVDEYQDTSHSQYIMIKLLSALHRNLCVVGDIDQSIYGWRGADFRNILNFERDYPDAKEVVLGQNYRSTKTILTVADRVIQQNTQRKPKQLWTENDQGLPVTLFEAYDESEEAQYVAREVRRLVSSGYSYRDIAVMYRTNAQSREIEQACVLYQVPYQLVGGVRFYSRREVKDVLSVLRTLHNPHSNPDFVRVINNTPLGKGIGDKTMAELEKYAAKLGVSLYEAAKRAVDGQKHNETQRTRPGEPVFNAPAGKFIPLLSTLEELIAERDQLPVVGLLDLLLTRTRYQEFLMDGTAEGDERWHNVLELRTVAENYADLPPGEALSRFLEDVALISDVDTLREDKDAVTLITLHAAKGLEFPVVFIVGMEEGMLPHIRALESEDESQMEEERRLAYVGITRAKERLYLVYAFRRTIYGVTQMNGPSRFLSDIPPELVTGRAPGTAFQPALFDGRGTGMSTRPVVPERGLSAEEILSGGTRTGGRARERLASPPSSHRTQKRREDKRQQQNARLNISSASTLFGRTAPGKQTPDSATPIARGFKVGEKVRHPAFGEGQVLAVKPAGQDEEVTVMFTTAGTKRLLASLARLERL